MVSMTVKKLVTEELEDNEVSKIILVGNINEIKFNLTLAGDIEAIQVLRKGLKIDGFGSIVDMQLKTFQKSLNDYNTTNEGEKR
jgi:hypothetical protein